MALRDIGRSAEREVCESFTGMTLEQKPIWTGLVENIRERFFPPKLPPLELTSTPIPVADRMETKTNPWALGTSTVVNGGILALVILLGLRTAVKPFADSQPSGRSLDLGVWKMLVAPRVNPGGGTGGDHDMIAPIEGRPPRVEVNPIVPPQVAIVTNPILAVDSAIAAPPDVKLPEDSTLPNVGVQKSYNVTLDSNGPGGPSGIGTNPGDGVGPGKGSRWGPGADGTVYMPGSVGVTAPIPIYTPEAEFSDEARRQKYQGVCLVGLIVDTRGNPQNVHVVRALGMGLDEKAMEAIRRYRFRPAMKAGKPVLAAMTIEVDFRLF
jgi:periplasmic protein TonB